jgi:hypothetical protein
MFIWIVTHAVVFQRTSFQNLKLSFKTFINCENHQAKRRPIFKIPSKIILCECIKDSLSLHVDVAAAIFTSYTLHGLAIALKINLEKVANGAVNFLHNENYALLELAPGTSSSCS